MTNYDDLKPEPGEDRYVDYDDEFGYWAIFGESSGFCYSQHEFEFEAYEALEDWREASGYYD